MYHQKSMNLQRKGEIVALTGGAVGLLGILLGTVATDTNSSNGDLNMLGLTAAVMMAGGVAATVTGFTFYVMGASRTNKINKVRTAEALRFELIPGGFYCREIQNCQTGITLRMSF